MQKVQDAIQMLGYPVRDKVTGFMGVITCISFDLPGCIQAIVNPGVDKDGEVRDGKWFDLSRLEVTNGVPVMAPPDFSFRETPGPVEKPEKY